MSEPRNVRAHHLGCLAHFAVYGGEHPTLPILLDAFRAEPDRSVRVVVGPDDICEPCPYWDGQTCRRKEDMEPRNRAKDAAFLEALGLADGEVRTPRELVAIMTERLTDKVLAKFCPTCNPEDCARAVQAPWLEP